MQTNFCLLVLGVLLCCWGCDTEPNVLGLSTNGFSQDYGVVVVDTLTVGVSTVLLDSFPTSGTGTLLIGGYTDNKLGKLQAEGYVQVGLGSSWEPPVSAVYDSLVLVARYSGYTYGDTTATQTLEVRRITQEFKTYTLPQFWIDEKQYSSLYLPGSIYNSSTMRYDANPLGSRTIRIRPHSSDSLVIHINDELGKAWFQYAKDKAPTITEEARFLEDFKGLVITNTAADPTCVFGLNTEKLKLRLYYRHYVKEELVQTFQEFPFSSTLFNYSKISTDRTGTVLENLTPDNNELTAKTVEGEAYIQAGAGLVTKLTFPYLNKLIDLKTVLIVNEAQLIIEPIKDSFDETYPLPTSLTLFHTNSTNLPQSQVYANYQTDAYQTAYISFDKEFDTSSAYTFSLTQYMQSRLSSEGNQDLGLLLMPPSTELNKTVNRVHLGAGSGTTYRVRLKVWFMEKR